MYNIYTIKMSNNDHVQSNHASSQVKNRLVYIISSQYLYNHKASNTHSANRLNLYGLNRLNSENCQCLRAV